MRELQLDTDYRLCMALGYLVAQAPYLDNEKIAVVIGKLQLKLDTRIVGIGNFSVKDWINEILEVEALRKK